MELLVPDGGAQQGPEGTEELPPRPVLDRQERSHVLLDALCGQSANLQGKETRTSRGPSQPREGGGKRAKGVVAKGMEKEGS